MLLYIHRFPTVHMATLKSVYIRAILSIHFYLLPPANQVAEGNVFTVVCLPSVVGDVITWLPEWPHVLSRGVASGGVVKRSQKRCFERRVLKGV